MKKIKTIKVFLIIRLVLSFAVALIGLLLPKFGIIAVLSLGAELFESLDTLAYGIGAILGLLVVVINFIRQLIAFFKVLKLDKMSPQDAVKTAQRINKFGGAFWAYFGISLNTVFTLEAAKIDVICFVLFIITWIMRRMVRKSLDNMLVELIGSAQQSSNLSGEIEQPESKPESKPRSNASKFD